MCNLAMNLRLLTLLALAFGFVHCSKSKSRFTNLKCESFDKSFGEFKKCKLNLLARGVVGLDIYISLYKLPISNILFNSSMWRRHNGYQPFLFNETTNLCDILAGKRNFSFARLILNVVRTKSNLNHTCPYNHDIIIDNLIFGSEMLKFSVPRGDYKFQLKFAVNNEWKLQVEAFILNDEDIENHRDRIYIN